MKKRMKAQEEEMSNFKFQKGMFMTRELELRRLDEEIARAEQEADRRRHEADERIVDLNRRRALLEATPEPTRQQQLEAWAEDLERRVDPAALESGSVDLTAWIEAIPFSVLDIEQVANWTLQIARLRAQRKAWIEGAVARLCSHPDCDSEPEYDCLLCTNRFCFDLTHGWPDAPTLREGETAAICWSCQQKLTQRAAA
jgi:hypothetical protein